MTIIVLIDLMLKLRSVHLQVWDHRFLVVVTIEGILMVKYTLKTIIIRVYNLVFVLYAIIVWILVHLSLLQLIVCCGEPTPIRRCAPPHLGAIILHVLLIQLLQSVHALLLDILAWYVCQICFILYVYCHIFWRSILRSHLSG